MIAEDLGAARKLSEPRPFRPQHVRPGQSRGIGFSSFPWLRAAPNMGAVLVPDRGLSGRSTWARGWGWEYSSAGRGVGTAAPRMGAVRSLASGLSQDYPL